MLLFIILALLHCYILKVSWCYWIDKVANYKFNFKLLDTISIIIVFHHLGYYYLLLVPFNGNLRALFVSFSCIGLSFLPHSFLYLCR